MSDMDPGRIGEQHDTYRRGLVLGLTMAEVGILIIFVLLLLIAFNEHRQRQLRQTMRDATPVKLVDLKELQESKELLEQLRAELGVSEQLPPEDFRKLVRAIQPVLSTGAGPAALAELQAEIERQKAVTAGLQEALSKSQAGKSDEIIRKIEAQSHELANKEGQLKRYEQQLERSGQGKGVRPCWVEPDGTIDYLYDVVLTGAGIRMREYQYPSKAAERALLPMPATDPSEALSEQEFLRRTRPLYASSEAANCRFFVWIYDGTGPQDKELYKRLRRTVEGHFYINPTRQDRTAPF